jgi:hypothetical protein
MKQRATIVASFLALLLLLPFEVKAQTETRVTVRDIHNISQDNINNLINAGRTLTNDQVNDWVLSPYAFQRVVFVGVVIADPLKSGLASPPPARVHYFVRDTSANTLGPLGMDVQIVDGQDGGAVSRTLFVGDVVEVRARINYFGNTVQLDQVSFDVLGDYTDFDFSEDILDPVKVTIQDVNMNVAGATEDPAIQANWNNFREMSNQFVRIDSVRIQFSDDRTGARPNWAVGSADGSVRLLIDDISLRYRNDRGDYPAAFDKRDPDDPFVGPPIGALVNLQGFVMLRGTFNPFGFGGPPGGMMRIAPWNDEHLHILEQPPISIVTATREIDIPGEEAVPVTVVVGAEDPAEVAAARLFYRVGSAPEVELALDPDGITPGGDPRFVGEIPAQAHGVFVTFRAQARDQGGRWYDTERVQTYRVLEDGITKIDHIRRTASGLRGESVFHNQTVPVDITARVQSDPDTTGLIIIQDDENLGAWSGIHIAPTAAARADLAKGDVIHITEARVERSFEVMRLTSVQYTKVGTEEPFPHKVIASTDAFTDASLAESHVGMLVRWNDIVITNNNPDAPSNFGEFTFNSGGTTASLRADDQSEAVPFGFNLDLSAGQQYPYIQGMWHYSFGNYKLLPEVLSDVGGYQVSSEEELTLPGSLTLQQNYPNPFNPVTRIAYEVPANGQVRLEVFDMLGRRVATLVDGTMTSGAHEVTFDAQTLPSGVYVYRLETAGRTLSRTMMLVK